MVQKFFRNKNILKKLKTKEHNSRQNFSICIRNRGANEER